MSGDAIDSSEDEFVNDDNLINANTQGPMLDYLFQPHSFNSIESTYKFSTETGNDSINYYNVQINDSINYYNVPTEKWNYARNIENAYAEKYVENRQNIPRQEYLSSVKHGEYENTVGQKSINKPGTMTTSWMQLYLPHFTGREKITSTPDYSSYQLTTITQITEVGKKLQLEKMNKFDYFDKSESDEEGDKLIIINAQTDIADYVHVPVYEMENTLVKDTSK